MLKLLQKKLGREPNVREISEAVGLPQATVTLALESVVEPVSLYEPVYSDGGDTIYVMDQVGETGCEEKLDLLHPVPRHRQQAVGPREKNHVPALLGR